MSWTKREFINEAYGELGYSSYQFDLQPEQLQSALRKLDSMMATWYTKGIKIGYPLPSSPGASDLDDNTTVPDSANQAIYLNLAIYLAPSIGKMASMDLKMGAKLAYNAISSNNAMPQEQQVTGLPKGAGHKYWVNDGDAFLNKPNTDPLQIGDGGELEFLGD